MESKVACPWILTPYRKGDVNMAFPLENAPTTASSKVLPC